MIVVYTQETPPDSFTSSIFLAGPSPRERAHPNWRAEAIEILERLGYQGVVFAPVWRDMNDAGPFNYDSQINWEKRWLNASDQIIFWVPRDLDTLPGFTTNVEFGMWLRSGKILLGSPLDAPKMEYMRWWGAHEGVENFDDLTSILKRAVDKLSSGALRHAGQRDVPLHLWLKPEFQHWLRCHSSAGNRLLGAEVVWVFRVGKNKERAFLWALHARMWIESEQREKSNEVVIFRPDVSTIVAYCPPEPAVVHHLDTEILIVREFRSPAATMTDAMIHELPGGSSPKPGNDPLTTAGEELREEAGLVVAAHRFEEHGTRQIAATLSAHRAHVFSVRLTQQELRELREHAHEVKGNEQDTERTWVEVRTVRDLLISRDVDWSNLGMILHALLTS
jgi:8-oxo-dGTP pyrophosphatase MutT (NUDIX family)